MLTAEIMFDPLDFEEHKVLWVKCFSGCPPVDFNVVNIFFLLTYLIKHATTQSGRQIVIFY
jgi:hypothetical protein